MQYHTVRQYFKKFNHIEQKALAKTAGISPSLLSMFRTGKRKPREEQIEALNAALDVEERKLNAQLFQNRIR